MDASGLRPRRPPIVLALAVLLGGRPGHMLFEAYVYLGYLSPVLSLVTWAILLTQYSLFGEELEPMRMRRRPGGTCGGALAMLLRTSMHRLSEHLAPRLTAGRLCRPRGAQYHVQRHRFGSCLSQYRMPRPAYGSCSNRGITCMCACITSCPPTAPQFQPTL